MLSSDDRQNGLTVQAAATDAGGRAQLPKPGQELNRERAPSDGSGGKDDTLPSCLWPAMDASLISRVSITGGGRTHSASSASTYLFTDRGIYRPGETTHLWPDYAHADWTGTLAGLLWRSRLQIPWNAGESHVACKLSAAA